MSDAEVTWTDPEGIVHGMKPSYSNASAYRYTKCDALVRVNPSDTGVVNCMLCLSWIETPYRRTMSGFNSPNMQQIPAKKRP